MRKWEYKTLKFDVKGVFGGKFDEYEFTEQLNLMGSQGWELVSVFDTDYAQGGSRHVLAAFKREIGM